MATIFVGERMADTEHQNIDTKEQILISDGYIIEGRQCVNSDGELGWMARSLGAEGPSRSFWINSGTIYGATMVESMIPGRVEVEIFGEAKRVEPGMRFALLRAVGRWSAQ
jgi:hypothetical protein